MRILLMVLGLVAFGASVSWSQTFVFTQDSIYRCDEIVANGSRSELYVKDRNSLEKKSIRQLDHKSGIVLIAFSSVKQKRKFENRTDLTGIQYRVLDPMPSWLKDSLFTGPIDDALMHPDLAYRPDGKTTEALLLASGIRSKLEPLSDTSNFGVYLEASGYEMERSLRKRMAGMVLASSSVIIGGVLVAIGASTAFVPLIYAGSTVMGVGGAVAIGISFSSLKNDFEAARYLQKAGKLAR